VFLPRDGRAGRASRNYRDCLDHTSLTLHDAYSASIYGKTCYEWLCSEVGKMRGPMARQYKTISLLERAGSETVILRRATEVITKPGT